MSSITLLSLVSFKNNLLNMSVPITGDEEVPVWLFVIIGVSLLGILYMALSKKKK